MSFIATATPSEAIDPEFHILSLVLFLAAVVTALIALLFRFIQPSRIRTRLAFSLFAAILGLYPLCLATYVYQLDFVAVEIDGTPASPPFWVALAIPSLPIVFGLALILHTWREVKRRDPTLTR